MVERIISANKTTIHLLELLLNHKRALSTNTNPNFLAITSNESSQLLAHTLHTKRHIVERMVNILKGFDYNPPSTVSSKKETEVGSHEVDYNKNPTLLFIHIEERAWSLALKLLESNSAESQIWVVKKAQNNSVIWRRLPIHQACICQPTAKIVLTLLQSFPSSAREVDSDRRLAIHHACANGASVDVVKHLLMAHPDSVRAQDNWSKTPMQIILSTPNPDPAIISALKKGPQYYRMKVSELKERIQSNRGMAPNSDSSVVSSSSRANSIKAKSSEVKSRTSSSTLSMFSCVSGGDYFDPISNLPTAPTSSNDQKTTQSVMTRELESNEHYQHLQEENYHLKNELDQYHMEMLHFDEIKQSEQNLRYQLESDNDRINDLENKLVVVSDELKAAYTLQKDAQEAKEEANVWKRQVDELRRETESKNQELEALRALAKNNESLLDQFKTKLTEANNEKEQLMDEMKQLDKHLFAMESKMKDMTEIIEKTQAEKEELTKNASELGRISEVEKKISYKEQENEILKQALTELKNRISDRESLFQKEKQSKENQIVNLEDELKLTKEKWMKKEDQMQRLNETNKRFEEMTVKLQRQVSDLSCRDNMVQERVETENRNLQFEVKSLKKKLLEVKQGSSKGKDFEFQQLQIDHQKLKDAMLLELDAKEDLEAKIEILMDEVQKLENRSEDNIEKKILLSKLEELQAENDTLHVRLLHNNEDYDNNSTSSRSIANLEERLLLLEESKDKEIEALQREKFALEDTIVQLKEKLTSYENQIKSLKTEGDSVKLQKKKSIRQRLDLLEAKERSTRSFDDSSQFSISSHRSLPVMIDTKYKGSSEKGIRPNTGKLSRSGKDTRDASSSKTRERIMSMLK